VELERSGGELRPREIAKETLFARYSVTRLIDRLESQKLVKRITCPEDARGTVIQITRRGVSLRKKMWKVYAEAIRRHFADRLEAGDAEQLSKLLSKVIG
jgi:DNA-binding MarR family transcriptional regulator